MVFFWDGVIWVCLKIVYPIVPNGFADHYPYEKWLFHWELIYPTFSDKPRYFHIFPRYFPYISHILTIDGSQMRVVFMLEPLRCQTLELPGRQMAWKNDVLATWRTEARLEAKQVLTKKKNLSAVCFPYRSDGNR